jgi:hypothetical protein
MCSILAKGEGIEEDWCAVFWLRERKFRTKIC